MNEIIEPAIIDVHGLSKSFNHIEAVHHLSLKIRPGIIFGFLGPNGSGKTTSLRLLSGLMLPDQGSGTCLGFDLFKQSKDIQSQVGYKPQQFSLYRNLTIFENLNFIAHIYGISNRQKKLQEILDLFDLRERKNQISHTLSGGWQQRLSLAASILHSPRLLLLDEPTSGIDPQSRMIIWDHIQELTKNNVTVLLSTHYMDEAERCHELVYISNGKILAQGSVDEVVGSSGLQTWRITGKKLNQLIPYLKSLADIHIIEKGNEIRLNTLHPNILNIINLELIQSYTLQPVATSLEDVFIFKLQNKDKT